MTVRAPRFLLAITVMLSAIVAIAQAGEKQPEFTWRDWNSGLREAASANRPVLVDVYTDWCGWCKRMDRDVYAQPEVRDYLSQHFVLVRLNAESPAAARYEGHAYTLRTLASRFRVSGYPTT